MLYLMLLWLLMVLVLVKLELVIESFGCFCALAFAFFPFSLLYFLLLLLFYIGAFALLARFFSSSLLSSFRLFRSFALSHSNKADTYAKSKLLQFGSGLTWNKIVVSMARITYV